MPCVRFVFPSLHVSFELARRVSLDRPESAVTAFPFRDFCHCITERYLIRCTTRVSTRVGEHYTLIFFLSFFFFIRIDTRLTIDSKNFGDLSRKKGEVDDWKGAFRKRKCHFGDAGLNISN